MKKTDRYCFPAVFSYEEGQEISVFFPDLDVATSGVNDDDALLSARELLGCVLCGLEEDKEEIPEPTPLAEVHAEKNERSVLIDVYMQIFNLSYNASSNLMMVTLIFFSCLFTALGFFDNWVSKAGAGLFVPISGFAHATTSSALEYKKEGLVFGIGSNIFKLSGSVILYGVISAYIFGIVRFVFFGG